MVKKKIALLLSLVIAVLSIINVYAEEQGKKASLPYVGETVYNFKVTDRGGYDSAEGETVTFEHIKSGAKVVFIQNDDENLTFNIAYRTPNTDESDRNHVFEHAIIASSDKYPATDIFFDVANKTYSTYVNAMTTQTTTNYMLSSMSQSQLEKMVDVYLSCMVSPGVLKNENFFKREAINYTLESKEANIELGGTVFSEDMGYLTDETDNNYNAIVDSLYPEEIASNTIGKSVNNYKILTYEHTKELYDLCYHFDNCLITLYGNMYYKKMLKFMDENYLSKYDRNNTDLSQYKDGKTPSGFVDKTVYYPVNVGASADDAMVLNYAVDLSQFSYEDKYALLYLSSVFNSENSIIRNNLNEAGIYNSFNCTVSLDSAKAFINFGLYNGDDSIKNQFKDVIDNSLKYIGENGEPYAYTSEFKAMEISDALARENFDFGVNSALNLSIYWAETGKTDVFELENNVFNKLLNDKNQTELKRLATKISKPERSAFVTVIPKPGMAEEINAEREKYLSDMKANMSEAEINKMIEDTKAYNEWNNNPVHFNNIAIKPSELPSVSERPQVTASNINGIESYSSVVDKNVGAYSIRFSIDKIKQEDLYYLGLYDMLLGAVDTDKYTADEILDLSNVYLNNLRTDITYYTMRGKEKPEPYYNIYWYCLDGDYEKSVDLILNMLQKTDFSKTDDIEYVIESVLPNIDPGKSSGFALSETEALKGVSNNLKFMSVFSDKEYYEFLENVLYSLKNDKSYGDKLKNKLIEISKKVVNKDNIITTQVANASAVKTAEGINGRKLNTLASATGTKEEYNFAGTPSSAAYIIEMPNQSSYMVCAADDSFRGEFLPYISMINDVYTLPEFRFKNGVYSAGTGFGMTYDSKYMYSYTYSDPNVGKTVEIYKNTVSNMKNEEISQETLNSYIVSAYGSIVMPIGEYTMASGAINYEIYDLDKNAKKRLADGIKNAKLQDMNSAFECIGKMIDNGYIVVAGNADAINADRAVFDTVIDLRSN